MKHKREFNPKNVTELWWEFQAQALGLWDHKLYHPHSTFNSYHIKCIQKAIFKLYNHSALYNKTSSIIKNTI